MQFLNPLAIVIAGVLIGGALLSGERYQVWQDNEGLYLVHDTWTGGLTGCVVEGTAPEINATCSPVTSSTP